MRLGLVILICLCCVGCTGFQRPVAQASAPQPPAAPERSAPVADAAPAKFECSDGTISTSQEACQVAMARARLPPSQTIERTPINPARQSTDPPTGSVR